ncbi:UNVERIFIED_CONTAM: Histone-lysine N-methyltransferase SETMAR [Trichonephila clavipes]
MYAIFFKSTGLIKAIKLEEQKTVTANWYTIKCLPEILQEVNVRGLMLHHDSASSHTVSLPPAEFLKQTQIKVTEHPPYSSDLAMCDFWLFINLKKNLRGRRFHSDDIDVAINAFFHQFQEINIFRHLNYGKFVYKSALMLEENTLNTPKNFSFSSHKISSVIPNTMAYRGFFFFFISVTTCYRSWLPLQLASSNSNDTQQLSASLYRGLLHVKSNRISKSSIVTVLDIRVWSQYWKS